MKVLVVGGGGREHALCRAIVASPLCKKLYCAPGNAGIENVAVAVAPALAGAEPSRQNKVECLPIAVDQIAEIVSACKTHAIDFVVIGPDAQLEQGMADALHAAGIACFGPTRAAAEIEWSKGFMKDLCARTGVPTAMYKRFTDAATARDYVRQQGAPIVVKADGLAAGKGVTIAQTIDEAIAAIDAAMIGGTFGAAGAEIVIEEFMQGEEVSFFALCDGRTATFFATAQDHKAAFDGDQGPNTGGMGAYSPAPIIDDSMRDRIMRDLIDPVLNELRDMGRPFSGVLYAGLMMTKTGPRIVEFNARFGDPETQVILPRLKSDLLSLLYACARGMLDGVEIEWHDRAALTVIMATRGYPGDYQKGSVIRGLENAAALADTFVYHAGTVRDAAGNITANGGRVLCVTATATTIAEAQQRAYHAVDHIDWPEGFCRRDIGWRAIGKGNASNR